MSEHVPQFTAIETRVVGVGCHAPATEIFWADPYTIQKLHNLYRTEIAYGYGQPLWAPCGTVDTKTYPADNYQSAARLEFKAYRQTWYFHVLGSCWDEATESADNLAQFLLENIAETPDAIYRLRGFNKRNKFERPRLVAGEDIRIHRFQDAYDNEVRNLAFREQ